MTHRMDEHDPWESCRERMESQFREAIDWLGNDWVGENFEPMVKLIEAADGVVEYLKSEPDCCTSIALWGLIKHLQVVLEELDK